MIIGINYEGGKSVPRHPSCMGWINIQVCSDKSFGGGIVDEQTMSEQRFDKEKHKNDLSIIFRQIHHVYPEMQIVIRVARGRSAIDTIDQVLLPVIIDAGLNRVQFVMDNYTPAVDDQSPFVFVNYGMFAEVSDDASCAPGEICNPVITEEIVACKDGIFQCANRQSTTDDEKNIMLRFSCFRNMILYGIADDMPDNYKEKDIMAQLILRNIDDEKNLK